MLTVGLEDHGGLYLFGGTGLVVLFHLLVEGVDIRNDLGAAVIGTQCVQLSEYSLILAAALFFRSARLDHIKGLACLVLAHDGQVPLITGDAGSGHDHAHHQVHQHACGLAGLDRFRILRVVEDLFFDVGKTTIAFQHLVQGFQRLARTHRREQRVP